MRLIRDADVVHEAFDFADGRSSLADELRRTVRISQVHGNAEHGPRLAFRLLDALAVPAANDDARAFGGQKPSGLESDSRRRAGHEAHAISQAEVHAD